jgi:hypothetical protein
MTNPTNGIASPTPINPDAKPIIHRKNFLREPTGVAQGTKPTPSDVASC